MASNDQCFGQCLAEDQNTLIEQLLAQIQVINFLFLYYK